MEQNYGSVVARGQMVTQSALYLSRCSTLFLPDKGFYLKPSMTWHGSPLDDTHLCLNYKTYMFSCLSKISLALFVYIRESYLVFKVVSDVLRTFQLLGKGVCPYIDLLFAQVL